MTAAEGTFVERAARWLEGERGRLQDAYRHAIGRHVRELPTPALLLDRPAAERNIARMARGIAERHSALRPHIKVHKCPDLSRAQVAAGAIGLSVATVWEAVVMAAAGIDDIFVVNTVAGEPKLRTLATLARERRVLLAVDEAGQRGVGGSRGTSCRQRAGPARGGGHRHGPRRRRSSRGRRCAGPGRGRPGGRALRGPHRLRGPLLARGRRGRPHRPAAARHGARCWPRAMPSWRRACPVRSSRPAERAPGGSRPRPPA